MTDDITKEVERIDGVKYTTLHGATFRVVFDQNAPIDAMAEVCETVGSPGTLGATQEHYACAEFPAGETSKIWDHVDHSDHD